jgi:hypothetical protein
MNAFEDICPAHQRRVCAGAEEIVVDPLTTNQSAWPREMNFGIEEVNIAGGDDIGNVKLPSHQKFIHIPGSTPEDAGGLGANPILQLTSLKSLEDGQIHIQGDGFIA